ncbi:putative alpha/beta-hydrolase family hydrolase [Okibacterium sp. HSC-33S16]|uniref:alpha/beta hydrolase family protein n=1 Tax=Okibacterium sp. HSC-33S16 TaxID=2910965 RepID=UPI0020A17472|nr:alpha/beta family hydrolase [Okibacterium sp. HSC-33S16]MCP2030376.1 putative alpha/beta-hydrolase family hydrolase [Okibacterium sp. HSC-33S16]
MIIDVPTSLGPGRLTVSEAALPRAVVWLGHGAGGGIGALDLVALAEQLPAEGFTVARYEQPWRVAGKKIAPRPAALDIAWRETAGAVFELASGVPLVVGGRSAGARVACRTADDLEAAAVICLAFPLHPPGKPEKTRRDELLLPTVPTLVLQGDRDTFGTAIDLEREIADTSTVRVVPVAGADHGMKVLASSPLKATDVAAHVTASVTDFLNHVLRTRR